MAGKLDGKVALVTGGTSGIGAGAVRRLTEDGAKVIFTGSKKEPAEALCAETGAAFESHRVQDVEGWQKLSDRIRSEYGRLDIAFANAGMEAGDGSVEDVDVDNWNRIISVNQTGVMLTIQNAIRIMKDNAEGATGSIIVNSSMNAKLAMGNFVAYSVTKAAVLALAKSSAMHCGLSGYKIRVNSILPGVVATDMILNIMNAQPDPEAARGMYEGMHPMKRMAKVEEVAALVAFLASDEAAFISGADYSIDGAATAGTMGV
ncbi:NAD(P)-dependent dehydrogenase (short-subunit alcohol dehydrogenase family) [Novosphingobium marinum]|uniref:NAD(P)-dependent dehydrogenase (Short-subunit alcohol dehydrogenase family) n=1 Tax=Novosphingobium marinum TaxID=1514948 RepID=A0A7Y9XSH9_9SPHN|nr:NAD(P)-dependent dehydrogenase (short-subunit alcohol dehydrogenase family) [Novosphingobium marinum]